MKKILSILLIGVICLSAGACSSAQQEEEKKTAAFVVNPTKDKVQLIATTEEHPQKDTISYAFQVKNISEEACVLKDIVIQSCDQKLNFLDTTGENEKEELAPGQKSREFHYTVPGEARFTKIVGYQYIEKERLLMDTFDSIQVCYGSGFTFDVKDYTDEEILKMVDEQDAARKQAQITNYFVKKDTVP